MQGLSTATPDIMHRTAPPPIPQGTHMTAPPTNSSPQASKPPHKCTTKDPTPLMDSAHIDYHFHILFVLFLYVFVFFFELLLLYNKKYA